MHILTHNIVRSTALLCDLHGGSAIGLCPPDFVSRFGFKVELGEGQQQIFESFQEFCSICNRHKADSVLFLGDAHDGINLKKPGARRIFTDLKDQLNVAKYLLGMLVEPELSGYHRRRKLLGVSGSGYHGSQDVDLEDILIESLGGQYAHKVSTVKIRGTTRVANIRHKTRGFTVSALERLINTYLVAVGRKQVDPVHILLAGHGHQYKHFHMQGIQAVLLPGWKAYDDYSTAGYPDFVPQIGGAIMFIDDHNRIKVHHYLFPTPHIADKTLTM